MNKLLHIPNCWHEQIANAYNLELVDKDADIIILPVSYTHLTLPTKA